MQNGFIKFFKVVKFYFKVYWKLIAIFCILLIAYTFLLYIFPLSSSGEELDSYKKIEPGATIQKVVYVVRRKSDNSHYTSTEGGMLFSSIINYAGLGPVSVMVLAVITCLFINLIFLVEANKKTQVVWFALPLRKTEIFIFKSITIILINFLLSLLIVLTTIICLSFANDANNSLSKVFITGINFTMFNLLITSSLIFVSLLFVEKQLLANLLLGTVLVYILITYLVDVIYKFDPEGDFKNLAAIKYFSPTRLIVSQLMFSQEKTTETIISSSENDYLVKILYDWVKPKSSMQITAVITPLVVSPVLIGSNVLMLRASNFYL